MQGLEEHTILMTTEEEQAYNAIVKKYGQMIFHLAASERNNRHDGEDIAQETFLVLARNMHKVKDYERIDLWLLQVLEHQVLHYYRNTRQEVPWDDNEDLASLPDEGSLHTDGYDGLLEELPEVDKMIFRYLEMGYSLKEIASKMGISYIYCRVRKARAQKKVETRARDRHLLK